MVSLHKSFIDQRSLHPCHHCDWCQHHPLMVTTTQITSIASVTTVTHSVLTTMSPSPVSASSLTVNTMTALITPVTTGVITHFISYFKSPPLQCHPSCHHHDQFHHYHYVFICVTTDISVSPEPPLPSMSLSPPVSPPPPLLLSSVPPAPQRCLAP